MADRVVDFASLHARYQEQAAWTHSLRQSVYSHAGLASARRVLEVGAGTGVITADLARLSQALTFGLDLDPRAAAFARRTDPSAFAYLAGDGRRLPAASGAFDLVVCHFLLLWVPDPLPVLDEMTRVAAPGGAVLCLAEPDYGGRIDHPEDLAEAGQLQAEALARRGADPRIGRKLRQLLNQAGLIEVRAGLIGGEWAGVEESPGEWATLEADLGGCVPAARLAQWRSLDRQARRDGSRILFVPTFYAWGRKPAADRR